MILYGISPRRVAQGQDGFTLIELVIVIVLLGVLAAVAVPRYLAATTDARTAAINNLAGAVQTAKSLAQDRYRLDGTVGAGSVTLDGQAVTVLSGGAPTGDLAGIGAALDSTTGFTVAYAVVGLNGLTATYTVTGYAGANCSVVYYTDSGAGIFGTITTTVMGC